MVLHAALALFLPAALAAPDTIEQTVFERPFNEREHLRASFAVNRDLGRAWVEVQVIPNFPNGWPDPGEAEKFPQAVDGLFYDQSTKQVVYRNGTARVVCAKDFTFLWNTALRETGQCPLRVSIETRTVDDGFNLRKVTIGKVVLQLPSSPGAADSGH